MSEVLEIGCYQIVQRWSLRVEIVLMFQVRYHEDFEKSKGSFTPTTSDLVTERVKRNTQDFSDISYRGIQRRVVEMERRRAIEHDQETTTGTVMTRTHTLVTDANKDGHGS